ncbi:5-amino-6-uracil reductase [Podospora didyma]|uniref:2,5-diamino-6-ribosylamino-4(3H)-pyrimidinone 5'-phosphate reductase n=1 Tax=Podospora didyma TaxID=330526 RepID=A0AAE0P067_9PEZI|nr:5-amino-6-uracil reductase [Podospora didyma]
MADPLHFPHSDPLKLEPHLPSVASPQASSQRSRPFVTLTFATSLDSSLSLAPGIPTTLSGPYQHAAICIGVGTAVTDDSALNYRLLDGQTTQTQSSQQLRPHQSKVIALARSGLGLAPYIVTAALPPADDPRHEILQSVGGKYLLVEPSSSDDDGRFRWTAVLAAMPNEGLDSIMIEGGGQIINALLAAPDNALIDSIIVTIAPTGPVKLADVSWHPLGDDIVLCGKIMR